MPRARPASASATRSEVGKTYAGAGRRAPLSGWPALWLLPFGLLPLAGTVGLVKAREALEALARDRESPARALASAGEAMRGSALRGFGPTLAVLALVGVVAVAATGSTPSGTADGRRPSDVLLDTFFSLTLVALVLAAALFVYGLLQRKEIARELASGRYPRTTLAAWIAFVSLFTLAAYLGSRGFDLKLRGPREVADLGGEQGRVRAPELGASDPDAYRAEFAWVPVLAAVALAALAGLAFFAASRRRRPPGPPADAAAVAEGLAAALDDTLDDLRAEPDPRRAVIAAYARLERALAASGLARRQAETAPEYLARILDRLEVDRAATHRLTELFVEAKFSQHAIDQAAKEQAIAALGHVRDQLRSTARRQAQTAAPGPRGQVASA